MKCVLVVDDNDDNVFLFRFILQKRGYRVLEARTGLQGIEVAIREKPDLILMDIQLPDIDGFETTRRIRRRDRHVPIVALTSFAMASDREKAIAAGCSGHIPKPVDVASFSYEVSRHLEKVPTTSGQQQSR